MLYYEADVRVCVCVCVCAFGNFQRYIYHRKEKKWREHSNTLEHLPVTYQ